MKIRVLSRILFVLWIFSVFTPWFTYNAEMMGYCWGAYFLTGLLIPLLLIGIAICQKQPNLIIMLLSEFGFLSASAIYIIALGRWQEVCNIISGYHWSDGLHTAQPGYWISAFILSALWTVFHIRIIHTFRCSKTRS